MFVYTEPTLKSHRRLPAAQSSALAGEILLDGCATRVQTPTFRGHSSRAKLSGGVDVCLHLSRKLLYYARFDVKRTQFALSRHLRITVAAMLRIRDLAPFAGSEFLDGVRSDRISN